MKTDPQLKQDVQAKTHQEPDPNDAGSIADPLTDEDVAKTATNNLDWNPMLPKGINVRVANGWVTLDGTVGWQYQREDAENTVRFLSGVKGVINHITVQPWVSAIDVKIKIEKTLECSDATDVDKIDVATVGGIVILNGKVKSCSDRDKAERVAWSVLGVTNVENRIIIE